jgi:hypothetical protein
MARPAFFRMTSFDTTTKLTLRSPADLLAAVPYLLGFHPDDSVVLVALRGKRVIFQGRVDIPDPDEADGLVRHLADIAARQHPTGVTLIGYGPLERVVGMLDALGAAITAAGVPVLDVLRVHDGRYWSMLCDEPTCCPPVGVEFDVAATAVAAAATYEGLVALPDRAALAASLAPVSGAGIEPELAGARERLAGLPGGGRRRRAAARVAVREALDRYTAGARLDDEELAWLAVLLTDEAARDDAWRRVLAVTPIPEHQAVWTDVVRRVPREYVAAPATLLALSAWRAGNGSLADVAAQRALDASPGYGLAELVREALRAGVPPSAFEPVPETAPRRRRRPARLSDAA